MSYSNMYPVTQALTLLTHAMSEVQKDVTALQHSVQVLQVQSKVPSAAAPPPLPLPLPPPAPSIDTQALRSIIETGLRSSIRTSLQSDIQQGVRDERQLTESSLTIRYDAMVARIVKDHMGTALAELRAVIEDTIAKHRDRVIPVSPVSPLSPVSPVSPVGSVAVLTRPLASLVPTPAAAVAKKRTAASRVVPHAVKATSLATLAEDLCVNASVNAVDAGNVSKSGVDAIVVNPEL